MKKGFKIFNSFMFYENEGTDENTKKKFSLGSGQ